MAMTNQSFAVVPANSATSTGQLPEQAWTSGPNLHEVLVKALTTKSGVATPVAANSATTSSATTPNGTPDLPKLPAYADAGEFTSWLRKFLLVAEQKFGYGEDMYSPLHVRSGRPLFHPAASRPQEPESIAEFEARHNLK
ncbi:hypothetical protein HDU78_011326, partial [Chytriomyces hyalinus]